MNEFLLARIAEDEERARRRMKRAQETQLMLQDPWFLGRSVPGWHDWPDIEADAARVLAKCEADRLIVDEHKPYRRIYGVGCNACLQPRHLPPLAPGWPCVTLRALALPYADHRDYREEWRP